MIWLYVTLWVLGVIAIIAAFAVGVGARYFGTALVLFAVGIVLVGSAVVTGYAHVSNVHGVRPDEAPEFMRPGGT